MYAYSKKYLSVPSQEMKKKFQKDIIIRHLPVLSKVIATSQVKKVYLNDQWWKRLADSLNKEKRAREKSEKK